MSYATCPVQLVSCVVIDVLYDYKLSFIYIYIYTYVFIEDKFWWNVWSKVQMQGEDYAMD
jgi:hypothetical protein